MIGKSLITIAGKAALANASSNGRSIKPKYFKFSNQDLEINENLNKNDIQGFIQKDISLYRTFDANTVEFTCDVTPDEADDYTRLAGLYLEDGTLFMVAEPPYAFPPELRQTFKIQIVYQNATGLFDFQYLPYSYEENTLVMFDVSFTLGLQEIENARQLGLIKNKLGVK